MTVESVSGRFRILAQDPTIRVGGRIVTATVEVPVESLRPGPAGHRIHVIDYDATRDRFVTPAPVAASDPFMREDVDDLLGNPHFHAQNAFVIASKTLARFQAALGRYVPWGFPRGHQLKLAPHAFAGANAYYSRDDECLAFGYFRGTSGDLVYTSLSHDIVAHESTHALLDGVRQNFLLMSSPQQGGFHEAFADIVAILSVFELPEAVGAALPPGKKGGETLTREELTVEALRKNALLRIAEQMGREMRGVRGVALRESAELDPSPTLLDEREAAGEAHDLGEVLVAAMLRAFTEVWVQRLFPLGERGAQRLDRSLVIEHGATAAKHLLTMAIRALDYTPPVDLQFSEYLNALLTADTILNPDDTRYHYRDHLRRAFAAYGIQPVHGGDGLWDPPKATLRYDRCQHEPMRRDPEEVWRFIWENQTGLEVEPDVYGFVQSVRPTTRLNASGFFVRETVAEFVQILELRADELVTVGLRKPEGMADYQPVTLYGGSALIFDDFGRLKLAIGSGVRSPKQQARLDYLFEHGFFDAGGVRPFSLAGMHNARGGGPGLVDPYARRHP